MALLPAYGNSIGSVLPVPVQDIFSSDVKLDSAAAIGQLFAISGFDVGSGIPTVELADDDITGSLRPSVGVALLSALSGAIVQLLLIGEVGGLNTSAFEVGERLYLASGGAFININPIGWSQDVGYVTKKDAVDGRVFFDLSPRTEIFVDDSLVDIGNRTLEVTL